MAKTKTWAEVVQLNEQLPCMACGDRNRHSVSRVCSRCARKIQMYGDPRAEALRMSRLKRWLPEAHRLVILNAGHPGVAVYKAWLEEWIRASIEQPGTKPLARWVSNLRPEMYLDVLKVMVALKLCVEFERPWEVPSVRSYYYQALRLVLQQFYPLPSRHRDYWTKIPRPEIRAGALHIQKGCGALLAGFVEALKLEEEDSVRARDLMSQPLFRSKDIVPAEPEKETADDGKK